MRKNQSGSAHAVIVIVVVAAIIGALGFVLYKNFINKKDNTNTVSSSQPSSSTKKKVATKTLVMNTVFKNGLTLEYPENWTLTHEKSGATPPTDDTVINDAYTFTSPDSKLDLFLRQSANINFDITCDPRFPTKYSAYSYTVSPVWGTESYVEYVQDMDGVYVPIQELGDTVTARAVAPGDATCKIDNLYVFNTGKPVVSATKIYFSTLIFSHGDPDVDNMAFTTQAGAKAYLASQNAADIKSILLSLK